MTAIGDLSPRRLWGHFDSILHIPRPSGKEDSIRCHVLNWAAVYGFKTMTDEVGNVVVHVPATRGHEAAPIVVIQGHLDMVCEYDKGAQDPAAHGVDAYVNGDWVCAHGTTLGADNGIGLAAAMGAAESPAAAHGPLELLFTVNEETGLVGAHGLKPNFVTGRVLLNLDSEEEGTLYVGCAGGGDTEIVLPVQWSLMPPSGADYTICVSSCRGGHSGLDIIENRANAVKLLARVLSELRGRVSFGLIAFNGGDKHNAIPREAEAIVRITPEQETTLRASVAAAMEFMRSEFTATDPNLEITVGTLGYDGERKPLDPRWRDQVIYLLQALPHGVLAMSRDISGMAETSTNLARVRLEGDALRVLESSRSSVASALAAVRGQIVSCTVLAGGSADPRPGYPGWRPNMASPLLRTAKEVHTICLGREPKVTAIHAGLECGVIGERYPGMDMISFGPDIRGAHSPDERVSIPSVVRFWQLLEALLKRLSQ